MYRPENRLCDIIEQDPYVLLAMSRFGISLGFGDKSVEKICAEQKIDLHTFLSVINFISFGEQVLDNLSPEICLESLICYLENAHVYFLDFCIPAIKRKLVEALGNAGNHELSLLILKFYEEYAAEVKGHMNYETRHVFTYVRELLEGRSDNNFCIDYFADHHHGIHEKLRALKDVLIRFIPGKDDNLLNSALFDIINCEQDLMAHCQVEDRIFVPAVRRLESSVASPESRVAPAGDQAYEEAEEPLSEREKDIIRCVAHGLSNKEMADRLFISINTVTTHRRNIAKKLKIHSPAGLAIYAVLNGIVKIEDLK